MSLFLSWKIISTEEEFMFSTWIVLKKILNSEILIHEDFIQ